MKPFRNLAQKLNVDPYALLGLSAIIIVPLFVWLNYSGFFRGLVQTGHSTVKIAVPNSKTLTKNDLVREKGVNVGLVKSVEPSGDGRGSIVTLDLDKDAGTVYNDARAKVTWRTLLGGAFAVDIDPGNEQSGKLGSQTLPMSHSTAQVELDDVTSVVQGQAKTGLRTIPKELADAMSDPSVLPSLAGTLNRVAPDVEQGLDAVRGVDKDRDLKTLITQTGKTAKALDAPDDQLRGLVEGAAGTLHATADQQAALRSTISGAPATLDEVDRTLTDLDRTLDIANPVVRKLEDPAGDVAPSVQKLRPVTVHLASLLDDARPLLDKLSPTAKSLASTAKQGTPLIDELTPAVDRFDKTILPYLNETDPDSQHTTAEMVGPGLTGLAQVAAPQDRNGHILRFPASDGSSPVYGLPCQIYINNPDKDKNIACKSLQSALNTYLSYNPLKPNQNVPGPTNPTTRSKKR